jgi:hypothetical protein
MYGGATDNPYLPDTEKQTLDLGFEQSSLDMITTVRSKVRDIPLVTVQFSGRPMSIDSTLEISTAYLCAFRPGPTGGEAIVSAVSEEYTLGEKRDNGRANTLAIDWHSSEEDLRNFPVYKSDGTIPAIENLKFKAGSGIQTEKLGLICDPVT